MTLVPYFCRWSSARLSIWASLGSLADIAMHNKRLRTKRKRKRTKKSLVVSLDWIYLYFIFVNKNCNWVPYPGLETRPWSFCTQDSRSWVVKALYPYFSKKNQKSKSKINKDVVRSIGKALSRTRANLVQIKTELEHPVQTPLFHQNKSPTIWVLLPVLSRMFDRRAWSDYHSSIDPHPQMRNESSHELFQNLGSMPVNEAAQ